MGGNEGKFEMSETLHFGEGALDSPSDGDLDIFSLFLILILQTLKMNYIYTCF